MTVLTQEGHPEIQVNLAGPIEPKEVAVPAQCACCGEFFKKIYAQCGVREHDDGPVAVYEYVRKEYFTGSPRHEEGVETW